MAAAVRDEWRVALLRGINVGRAKRVAMADLRRLFEDLGYGHVRTLLNSGNVVFTAPGRAAVDPTARIEKAIAGNLGVATRVLVVPGRELEEALREDPLESIAANPSLHLLMMLRDSAAVTRLKPLLRESWDPEALSLRKRVAYLWCPGGTLKGRLWTEANRAVGDAGTSRNVATMTKLVSLMRSQP